MTYALPVPKTVTLTRVIPGYDLHHFPARQKTLPLVIKDEIMNSSKHHRKKLQAEQPVPETPPEIVPANEPGEPPIPAEDQPERPAEVPSRVSPYDFPPPGEGFFPEIFTV